MPNHPFVVVLFWVISMMMFSFLCNSKAISQSRNMGFLLKLFKFDGRRRSLITSTKSSTITDATINRSSLFTVSYLINSCGLSEHKAINISKKLRLKTSSRPDSVLTLLRNYGLTNTHISGFVVKSPLLLLANPNTTLKPKIEFFNSIGLSGTELADHLSKNPTILARSLQNHIIPAIAFLKTILHTNSNLIKVLKRALWILNKDPRECLASKIALLQAHGVPISNISSLFTIHPRALVQPTVDQFHEVVKEVREMGFDPSKMAFVLAVRALHSMNKTVWERKLDVYREWGWSEEDIRIAFMKQPGCMNTSEKKIMQIMDILIKKMGYDPSLIAQSPNVLLLSLEKRIIPRCSVLQILIRKGLVEKDPSLSTVFGSSEKYFLRNFVTKFKNEVPQLLDVFLGKVDALELPGWQDGELDCSIS